jgi:Tat protein secretion system quality control protein TatD with DNase activity
VPVVGAAVAAVKDLDPEVVAAATWETAERLFAL